MFVYDSNSNVICNFNSFTRISVMDAALVFEYENYKGNCIQFSSHKEAVSAMEKIVGSYNLRADKDFIFVIQHELENVDDDEYFYVDEETAAYVCDELCRNNLPFGPAEICASCKIKVID